LHARVHEREKREKEEREKNKGEKGPGATSSFFFDGRVSLVV
jgi:hypothetical protein